VTDSISDTLAVPGAALSYDVRRAAPSTDPILLIIGSPMGASGFRTMADAERGPSEPASLAGAGRSRDG
jgi:hypothetical protein